MSSPSSIPSVVPTGGEPNAAAAFASDSESNVVPVDDKNDEDNIDLQPRPRVPTPRRRMHRTGSQVFLPRLVNRNLPYGQSLNRVEVKNKKYSILLSLVMYDWFHLMLRTPIYVTIPSLLFLWAVTTLIFAQIYVYVDTNNFADDCGLGEPGYPIEFGTGFAFSLITVSTVGCKLMWRRCNVDGLWIRMYVCVVSP
jgi:hypothetical protein